MKHIALILTAAAILGTGEINAQQLQQEIEVNRQVVVEHADAIRLPLLPRVSLPSLPGSRLTYSDRTVSVDIPGQITPLEPTAYADTLETSPYSGYASLGYFPVCNLGASAGYRILDNDHSRLNAWLQYNGSSYSDSRTRYLGARLPANRNIFRHTATVGLSYHLMVGQKSEINAGLQYTFARFNQPGSTTVRTDHKVFDLMSQSVNSINASAQWLSSVGGLHYTAGVDYGYFGYSYGMRNDILGLDRDPRTWEPVREHLISLNGAAWIPVSDLSSAYLGIKAEILDDTRRSLLEPLNDGSYGYLIHGRHGHDCHGVISLNPRYRLNSESLQLTIGVLAQASFRSGKIFHFAPDVKVSWAPAPQVTFWAKAGGGEHINTLASLYQVNYMAAPMLAYRDSHLPITLEGGINAGPVYGGYAELFAGYAVANDWLMPVGYPGMGFAPSMFRAIDFKGWHAGIRLGYKYRRWVDAVVSAEAAPRKFDRGYYLWRDRAKYVIKAEVKSSPIDRLDVGITYELRACRAMIDQQAVLVPGNMHLEHYTYNLGNISLLSVNGAYRLTPQLSVFLSAENLLNRRVSTLSLIESQGVCGLAGVAYKF